MADFIKATDSLNKGREKLNAIAEEMGNKDVISAPEIIAARGGEADLEARLNKENNEVTSQLAQNTAQAAHAATEVNKKIDKNIGGVREVDLSQEVKDIINGDRPLPTAEVNSILTENIVDKQITRDKLSDDFTHNTPWITDPDASLDILFASGTYIIDGAVKASPINSMGILDVVASRTTKNNTIYRVIQIMYPLNGTKIHYRGFSIRSDTGIFVGEPTRWLPILNHAAHISDLKGFTSKGIATNTHIDTLTEEGTYFIGSDVEGNPYRSAILTVEKTYATGHPDELTNTWGIQRATSVDSPNKISVRYFRSLAGNLEVREWTQVAGIDSNWAVDSQWANKKYVAFGTSLLSNDGITDGRGGYADYISSTLGTNFENRGRGSGGITKTAAVGDTTMQRVKALASQPDDIDLITVEVGANDYGVPLGELGDTTQDTWYGALDMLCQELRKGTSGRVVLVTSTPARNSRAPGAEDRTPYQMNSVSGARDRAVEEVGEIYGLPVLNTSKKSGLMSYANDETYVDHIHLSELGAEIIGRYLAFELLKINPMPSNLSRL